MNEKDIIKEVMAESGINRVTLGEMCGYKSKSAITEIMNRTGMKVEIFSKLLSAMGCEIIIRRVSTGTEWRLDDDTSPSPIKPIVNLDTLLADE